MVSVQEVQFWLSLHEEQLVGQLKHIPAVLDGKVLGGQGLWQLLL